MVDIPIDLLAGGAPSFTRTPEEKKREVEEFVSTPIEKLKDVWLRVLSSENIAHKQWVYSQYDHEVQVRTHVKPGHDAAVLVLDPHVIALSCGCNPRHVGLSPYEGTKLSVLENVTNLACMGASPFCAVNCLNFGNPEDNKVYWEFSEAVRGLGDMCRTLNVPVVGGNVSFYNESEELGTEVLPTPSLGIVGRLNDEFSKMILSGNASLPSPRAKKNETLLLIGNTYEEMGGSEYSSIVGGGGTPPIFRQEYLNVIELVRVLVQDQLITAVRDLSLGGLASALCKLTEGVGANIQLDGLLPPSVWLFSESYGRVLVSTENPELVLELAQRSGVEARVLGATGGDGVTVEFTEGAVTLSLSEISSALGSLERLMRG